MQVEQSGGVRANDYTLLWNSTVVILVSGELPINAMPHILIPILANYGINKIGNDFKTGKIDNANCRTIILPIIMGCRESDKTRL